MRSQYQRHLPDSDDDIVLNFQEAFGRASRLSNLDENLSESIEEQADADKDENEEEDSSSETYDSEWSEVE